MPMGTLFYYVTQKSETFDPIPPLRKIEKSKNEAKYDPRQIKKLCSVYTGDLLKQTNSDDLGARNVKEIRYKMFYFHFNFN